MRHGSWSGMVVATAATLCLLGLTGCPEFQTGRLIESQDSVVGHSPAARQTQVPTLRMTQDGSRLGVAATISCEAYDMQTVEHTQTFERSDPMRATAQTMLWGGLAAGVVGGVLIGTASADTSSSTTTSSSSSSLSASEQRIGGGVIIGVGVVAAIIGGVRVLQGRGREQRTSRTQVVGPVTAPSVACPRPGPFAGVALRLEGPLGEIALGSTDDRGVLSVDLRRIVPGEWVVGPAAQGEVTLLSATHPLGNVSLADVRDHYDDQVWSRIQLDVCRTPTAASDCQAVQTYLRAFPAGRHLEEANAVIEAGRVRLAALEEQARREREAAEAARIERERVAEAERVERERAAEADRQREQREWEAQQARDRARQAQAEREWSQRQANDEANRRAEREAAQRRREARERTAACRARCRGGCGGNASCVAQCVAQTCGG